ncbi:MAG: hypothetical protein K6G55_03630 [Selenomonadaceae bacterium]|nr:hypothetical protein [Selenomonadaceae bacterium]
MRKKKVLVHGTLESLNKFFSDAVSRDYEIVALLSDEPEKISITTRNRKLDILKPQELPIFVDRLVDGIILTADKSVTDFFLRRGIHPTKIIFWDAAQGWTFFALKDNQGTQVIFFCGLEFHIRSDEDRKLFNKTVQRLGTQRQYKNINPQYYPSILLQQYQRRTGKTFDFNNPKTFTEKLQWMKLFDATPIKSRLADKYLVRQWVADKIGQEYLIPLLGVWDNFDDIDFDELPNQFVLKCNHGSGMNIIVRDKKTFDIQRSREKINAWLATDFAALFLEMHYTRIKRKIIAEKFMANSDLTDINNYKFWCFNGKPILCAFVSGRSDDGDLSNVRISFFDMNWKPTEVERSDHPRSEHPEKIPRPKNFELMKRLAVKLAEGFAHVRVDFYEIDGKVYFGEMTFTPGAGNFSYKSKGTDEYLGDILKLPEASPIPTL